MKKLILLIIVSAFLMNVSSYAQQALFGGQQIVSPEINANNTVTFRLNSSPGDSGSSPSSSTTACKGLLALVVWWMIELLTIE